jgi:hypothetical protein
MIPGLPAGFLAGSDEEGSFRLKRMIYITDSMTAIELIQMVVIHGTWEGWKADRADLAREESREGERNQREGGRGINMSVSDDGEYGKAGWGKEWVVRILI